MILFEAKDCQINLPVISSQYVASCRKRLFGICCYLQAQPRRFGRSTVHFRLVCLIRTRVPLAAARGCNWYINILCHLYCVAGVAARAFTTSCSTSFSSETDDDFKPKAVEGLAKSVEAQIKEDITSNRVFLYMKVSTQTVSCLIDMPESPTCCAVQPAFCYTSAAAYFT